MGEGDGRVLIVDGGGSRACSLVGDQLADSARRNGWAGMVVNGCVRDVEKLEQIDIGIYAQAATPRRSVRREQGLAGVDLTFGGVTWRPGDYVVVDRNGVVLLDPGTDVSLGALVPNDKPA